jgi:hypothetical protein
MHQRRWREATMAKSTLSVGRKWMPAAWALQQLPRRCPQPRHHSGRIWTACGRARLSLAERGRVSAMLAAFVLASRVCHVHRPQAVTTAGLLQATARGSWCNPAPPRHLRRVLPHRLQLSSRRLRIPSLLPSCDGRRRHRSTHPCSPPRRLLPLRQPCLRHPSPPRRRIRGPPCRPCGQGRRVRRPRRPPARAPALRSSPMMLHQPRRRRPRCHHRACRLEGRMELPRARPA